MLRSLRKMPLIAKEDIKVWKVLGVDNETGVDKFFTPTIGAIIPHLPYEQEGKILIGNKVPKIEKDDKGYYLIGEGFVHAYTEKKRASQEAWRWYERFPRKGKTIDPYEFWVHTVVGYIPTGTKYYVEGRDKSKQICAKRMVLTKSVGSYYYDSEDWYYDRYEGTWKWRMW